MDRYAVIGNPVAHSLSPEIHSRFASSLGETLEYGRLLAPLGEFAATAQRFFDAGGRGANVTLPFKLDAFAFAAKSSPRARLAGAANFLALRAGVVEADNTDGVGLVNDLVGNIGLDLHARRIAILGAGGAVRGVMGPLLGARPSAVLIVNRTAERAVELAASFASLGPVEACAIADLPARSCSLVINATSSSTRGEELELPDGLLAPGVFAYDMAYGPAAQPFVDRSRAAGATAFDGLGMLVEQAAESYYLWRGARPYTRTVLEELRRR
jgi:shikimate dehydrogenase